MRMTAVLALVGFVAAGCVAADGGAALRQDKGKAAAASTRELAFARARCAGCHAVGVGTSPRREAPSFEDVVNTPGLTPDTPKPWLRDSHNYPEIMNFTIAPEQIDDLAAYMLTLNDPSYRPPIY